MKRLLIVLLLGALVVGIADASALAGTKRKTGEQEFAWTTTGAPEEEDCLKEDETDADSTLSSSCWWQQARIIYRFLIPLKARLTGFSVAYYGNNYGSKAGCLVLDTWATRYRQRVSVHFWHHGADGNGNRCRITQVAIRYRVPS